MPRFTAIPTIPTADISDWQGQVLNRLKENVELLCGIRGETDNASRAITDDRITIKTYDDPTFTRVSATGEGFTISGVNVASLADFGKLINDVQLLANDVAIIRQMVNTIITQLKG